MLQSLASMSFSNIWIQNFSKDENHKLFSLEIIKLKKIKIHWIMSAIVILVRSLIVGSWAYNPGSSSRGLTIVQILIIRNQASDLSKNLSNCTILKLTIRTIWKNFNRHQTFYDIFNFVKLSWRKCFIILTD